MSCNTQGNKKREELGLGGMEFDRNKVYAVMKHSIRIMKNADLQLN